jgi:hypothetical protein
MSNYPSNHPIHPPEWHAPDAPADADQTLCVETSSGWAVAQWDGYWQVTHGKHSTKPGQGIVERCDSYDDAVDFALRKLGLR